MTTTPEAPSALPLKGAPPVPRLSRATAAAGRVDRLSAVSVGGIEAMGPLMMRVLVLTAATTAPVHAACGDGLPLRASGGGYTVAFAPRPAAIAVGQHFRVEAQVCAEPGLPAATGLKVDADMPAHRHGMNYRATVKPAGAQRWQADGLMFHMPGRWRFLFEVATPQGIRKLSHELEVE